MPIALDPARPFRYVLVDERAFPPEKQTTFLLRPLTARQMAEVQDMLVHQVGMDLRFRKGSQTLRILELGVVGWENFRDGSGNDVPFNGKDSDKNWDLLLPGDRTELANAVTEYSALSPQDRRD